MNLHEVKTGSEFPLKDGYAFIWTDGNAEGYGTAENPGNYSDAEWQNRLDRMADDLWDGYGKLYADESGNLYGVEVDSYCRPAVWARVEKKHPE